MGTWVRQKDTGERAARCPASVVLGFDGFNMKFAFSSVRFTLSLAGKAPVPPTLKLYLLLPHSEAHGLAIKPTYPSSIFA
jgi:hypothetical protein